MALPPLDYLLTTVQAYGLTTLLGEITPDLGQPGAVASSHIVVIDNAHRPLGAIALGQLWAAHATWGLTAAEPQLRDCQAWLEPVVAVEASQLLESSALAELGAIARSLPAPTLVAIDADGQYLGVISPTRLLGWLISEAAGGNTAEAQPIDQQAWVMELSHALKTPITTLLGLSTLLLDSRIGTLSDRQFRYVSLMRQAIRKLTSLVNLLLDWMRLDSEQIALNLERVNLQSLADSLLPSFLTAQPDPTTSADWVDHFTLRLADPSAWVMADSLRLRQSLHYGLGYLVAQGAIPGGLVVEPWGGWLGLTLWSAHPLGPTPIATPIPGKPQLPQSLDGLGLALARRLSQIHGGELSCLSAPTWGCRLTLLLPLPPHLPAAPPLLSTVPVLVASASDAILDRIYGSLRSSPYRLVVAPSCHHLVDMQQRLNPLCTLIHWPSLPDAPEPVAARIALVQSQTQTVILTEAPEGDQIPAPMVNYLPLATLAQSLRPTLDQICAGGQPPMPPASPPQGLTMLLLRSPEAAAGALSQAVQAWLQRHRCRLLQVDDLAQANLLSRVWQPQAVILDGVEPVSVTYLEALATYPDLAQLPLVTLVAPADGGAAPALGLALRVCPELLSQPAPQAVAHLLAAIAACSHPYPSGKAPGHVLDQPREPRENPG